MLNASIVLLKSVQTNKAPVLISAELDVGVFGSRGDDRRKARRNAQAFDLAAVTASGNGLI
jgi:hypothetical protein